MSRVRGDVILLVLSLLSAGGVAPVLLEAGLADLATAKWLDPFLPTAE